MMVMTISVNEFGRCGRRGGGWRRTTIEAESGRHVWANHYDRNLADISALQDEITDPVTIAIAPAIADAELQRAMRKAPGNLDAWAAYQLGLWHLGKVSTEDSLLAQRIL